MQRPVLIIIIVLICIGLLNSLCFNLLPYDSPLLDVLRRTSILGKIIYVGTIAKSFLMIYHFGSQKKWWISGSFAGMLIVGFILDIYQSYILDIPSDLDIDLEPHYSILNVIGYGHLVITLGLCVACILEGRQKYVWLMYFGIANGVITVLGFSLSQFEFYGSIFAWFRFLWLIPNIMLLVYFIKRLQPEPLASESSLIDDADLKEAKRKNASKDLVVGGLWFLGGISVTVLTYSAASNGGGTYFVAYGAIIFGAVQFIRGLMRLK
jgi:hypothetical protein